MPPINVRETIGESPLAFCRVRIQIKGAPPSQPNLPSQVMECHKLQPDLNALF